MMRQPTGSKIHRIWKCPASWVLPQNRSEDLEARTEPFRARGKEVHRFLELARTVGVDEALATVTDEETLVLCKALNLDALPAHLSTEVAYAWNWRRNTARELGRNLGHREYHTLPNPPTDDEIPCTLDAVGMGEFQLSTGGTLRRGYLGDYKTGFTRYPRPEEYGQTLLGAACVRSVMSVDDVTADLIYIDEHGEHYTTRDTIDPWTLDVFEAELTGVMESLVELDQDHRRGISLPVVEGDHCANCGAISHCTAKVGLVRNLPAEIAALGVQVPGATGKPPTLLANTEAITASTAGSMWRAIERIEEVIGVMKDEICKLAWHSPIDLGDGRVIEPYRTERRVLDGRIAAGVLERHYPREEVLQAIDIKLSLDAVKTLVAKHKDPKERLETRRGDGAVDKILAEIDRAGGLAKNTSEACKPRKRRGKKLGPGSAG